MLNRILVIGSLLLCFAPARSNADTIFRCACQFRPECAAGYADTQAILERAGQHRLAPINELAISLQDAVLRSRSLPHSREEFDWEIGEQIANLHELTSVGPDTFTDAELTELTETYLDLTSQITGRMKKLLEPQAPVLVVPTLAGAEHFALPEVTSPKFYIYVAPYLRGFLKWLSKESLGVQEVVRERLVRIAGHEDFGDIKPTNGQTHRRSKSAIYELRIHLDASPRIYFLRTGQSIVILNFENKTDTRAIQNQAIEKAGRVAETFLDAQ